MDAAQVLRAVHAHARRTPLLDDPVLTERLGRRVCVKAENLQVTGSFKVRGAAARLEALDAAQRRAGVVTCSSGNHGRAVAYVASRMKVPARIFVPVWVDPVKLEGIRRAGAEVVLEGDTFDEAEAAARAAAEAEGRVYVSAYDDPWVIAGQGTLAREVLDQLGAPPGALLAPLSGGGLLGGIAWTFRTLGADDVRCVGVSARCAAVMLASLAAGRPVELPEEETLANALAGGIGLDNRHSFRLVRELVEEHVAVDEADIARAMRYAVRELRLVLEGGGAVALAALLAGAWTGDGALPPDAPVVVVASGGNVDAGVLAAVLSEEEGVSGSA